MIEMTTTIDDLIVRTLIHLRPEFKSFSTAGGDKFGNIIWGDTEPVSLDEMNAAIGGIEFSMDVDELRLKRDELLTLSDWTQMPDVTGADKAAWASYRQDLRDLPSTAVDPKNPVWPVAP